MAGVTDNVRVEPLEGSGQWNYVKNMKTGDVRTFDFDIYSMRIRT